MHMTHIVFDAALSRSRDLKVHHKWFPKCTRFSHVRPFSQEVFLIWKENKNTLEISSWYLWRYKRVLKWKDSLVELRSAFLSFVSQQCLSWFCASVLLVVVSSSPFRYSSRTTHSTFLGDDFYFNTLDLHQVLYL